MLNAHEYIERMNALEALIRQYVRDQNLTLAIVLISQQPEQSVRDSLILYALSESFKVGLLTGRADAKREREGI